MIGWPGDGFAESPIAIVVIEVIIFMKIVTYINVRAAILIQVANDEAKAIANFAANNPRRFGYICKRLF